MSLLAAASARRRFAPAAIALLVLAPAACVNQIGVTCPPDDRDCDQPDLAAPAPDLREARDLQPAPDLAPAPDLLACKSACPNGCCEARGCVAPSLQSCGLAGEPCVRCDTLTADVCKNGKCQCGSSPACADGTRCAGGKCVCDAASCSSGCCDAGTGKCYPVDAAHCALLAGGACKTCDINADACQLGPGCQCGKNAPCNAGQRCVNGTCVCDAKSCPNGCCLKDACLPGNNFATCGVGGVACTSCQLGQTCASGACADILACAIGQIFCPGLKKCGIDCANCGNFAYQCPNGACVENCKNCPGMTAACVTNVTNKTCVKDCQACGGTCTP